MGFWPFGGGGKKQRASDSTRSAREQSLQSDPLDNMGRLEKSSTDISGNTKGSSKRNGEDKSRRLSKTQILGKKLQEHSSTAPIAIPSSQRQSRQALPLPEKHLYQHNPTSQSSLGPETFNVVRQPPTLHARRPENDANLARRKSSKRKAEDYAREREIRAMSSSPIPVPRRPASFYNSGPLQRETKDIPGALNRKLNRPTSQVSLPIPGAVSDVETAPYQHSFKIGTFAALSPRPTIKYDNNPRNLRGKQPQRPNPLDRPPTVDEEDFDKRRIDELADDLDAAGVRELMERDKRRRERKRAQDQARLQRKLQRRADRQKEEEARKARTEEYVSSSTSQIQGLGIDPSTTQTSPQEETKPGPSGTRTADSLNPFADPKSQPVSPVAIRNPFEDEKDMEVIRNQSLDLEREPAVPARSPLRAIKTDMVKQDEQPVQVILSPPISPTPRAFDRQSMSQGSILNREATADIPENASLEGRASDHSSQRLGSWTAFFRRRTRRKLSSSFQDRSTPSEFSNTSRESFLRKQQPPPGVTTRTFRRADSATPQRTMSKFREDLPELPISPPDSRMHSPETTMPPAGLGQNVPSALQRLEALEPEHPVYAASSSIPTSSIREEYKPSMELETPSNAKPEMISSQPLASVDSEGSWLSGKPLSRRSGASQRLKPSSSSVTRPVPEGFDGPNEFEPVQTTPPALERGRNDSAATQPVDETWHEAIGRQPTLIRQASRAKSKEGLLNEYTAGESRRNSSPDTEDDSHDVGPDEAELNEVTLMRARSVDYKKHVRHISAGSAKLLDIRRSSVQSVDLLSKRPTSLSQDQLTRTQSSS